MKLTMWTYEGPPHVGAMRIAASMTGVHYVLHAPQGDTYADLLFTMIERRQSRPPVTYTTFQARDLASSTADIFKTACQNAVDRFQPDALLVGASCTAELLQDDPGGLAKTLDVGVPVVALELPSYQKKEAWGAAETFYRLVRSFAGGVTRPAKIAPNSCNILGPTALGFRNRDDVTEITRLLKENGLDVRVVAPLGASPADLSRLPEAAFNIVLYPEIADVTARWLKKTHGMPFVSTVPIGVQATKVFITEVRAMAGLPATVDAVDIQERSTWYAKSVDSNYLTNKRVFIFGDATHAIAAARIASCELGFKVCGLGTYMREFAREVREAAQEFGIEALITDDHLDVEQAIIAARPELVLGTQMERHIAKRMRVPCAVISAPVHVQDFPARYSPQMGFEGANVIFDAWVHPLMMGLEEHLLQMFRDDFEFNDGAVASHLHEAGSVAAPEMAAPTVLAQVVDQALDQPVGWTVEAEKELKKIPFFVRGKARRNTELFAAGKGIQPITVETLYDAKAHFAR
ncbi:light-independent protochlorophyllide reductase subunit B [Rhizobium sp. Root274]|uniref:ferredoxin:protochlorophyllide reductase (ATP-dependent) subunit B n=1 Tax=unclassified Rhizobium TaxID=2613769 RepID=UPI000713EF86|nr:MULTISPECIES: ferredoxin:protochlorophyllide reductase (ATP-dependent) subunit B [unclassified Rhizobium]KQW29634.1 light-independent protochlorophyllide reductase subunit B [Rhizobium sp. Root1240]KRD29826.1 light-independent protochlorophyllide reductase subunit B [Rhizobium sp. Root274]